MILMISHPTTVDVGFLQECCQAAINGFFCLSQHNMINVKQNINVTHLKARVIKSTIPVQLGIIRNIDV